MDIVHVHVHIRAAGDIDLVEMQNLHAQSAEFKLTSTCGINKQW